MTARRPKWIPKEGDYVTVTDQSSPFFCHSGRIRHSDHEMSSVDMEYVGEVNFKNWLIKLLIGPAVFKVPNAFTFRNNQLQLDRRRN